MKDRFIELWLSGVSASSIARELGIPVSDVYVYAAVYGLPARKGRRTLTEDAIRKIRELYLEGYSIERIAKMVGLHRDTVYKCLRAMGLVPKQAMYPWLKVSKRELLRHVVEHRSVSEIAQMYGVPVRYVRRLLSEFGIKWVTPRLKRAAKLMFYKGFVTSRDANGSTLKRLAELADAKIFTISRTSTRKYVVLSPFLANQTIVYIDPEAVADYIYTYLNKDVPRRVVTNLFRRIGVPEEVAQLVVRKIVEGT